MTGIARSALFLLFSLSLFAITACATGSAAGTPSPTVTPTPFIDLHPSLDEPFDLPVNGSALLDANGYRVTFIRVVQDNRCPEGLQCPFGGSAVVELAVRQSATAGETRHELGIGADSTTPDRKIVGGFEIELQGLEPEPTGGEPGAEVTLVAHRADTRLNITANATPLQVPTGGVIEVTTDAGGSGIPQYKLWIENSPVSTLRYDGTTVSETPVEGMVITGSSADSSGATWSIQVDVPGQFAFKVSVDGEIRAGTDGPYLFAYGEETFTVTVGG